MGSLFHRWVAGSDVGRMPRMWWTARVTGRQLGADVDQVRPVR